MSNEPMVLDLRAPHQKYYTKDGEQVSGVTTVLGELAKPALLNWTGCEERAGILSFMGNASWNAANLSAALPKTSKGTPKLFADMKRDKAADLGTIAHAHIEAWHQGRALSPEGLDPVLYEKAKAPFERFKSWWNDAGLTLVHAELQMVSEKWRVGGTADQIARRPDGKLELWDTKTGKPWYNGRPYPDQIAQAVAYAEMYEELTGEHIDFLRSARVGKTEGDEGDLYLLNDREREAGLERWLAALGAHRSTKKFNALWKGGSK